MTNDKYRPIPGEILKRGRPSLETLKAREAYWKAQEKSITTVTTSNAQNILERLVEATKAAPSTTPQPQAQTTDFSRRRRGQMTSRTIPANSSVSSTVNKIEEIIKSKIPVALNKEDLKVAKDIIASLPQAQRGRPSKEYIAAKQQVTEKLKALIADKIKQIKSSGGVIEISTDSTTHETNDDVLLNSPPASPIVMSSTWSQFKLGDHVKLRRVPSHKGVVWRHDIGARSVFVAWKDGSKDWRPAELLVGYHPGKKEILEEVSESENISNKDQ